MDIHCTEIDRLKRDPDIDEALIHALYLRLKSEIETRKAIIDAASHGASIEVLEAIAIDPVPIIDEPSSRKKVTALLDAFRHVGAERLGVILDSDH